MATSTTAEQGAADSTGGALPTEGLEKSRRQRVGGIRTRILLPFVATLALATALSVLVAREVLHARLDERIDQELAQEVSELRRLAADVDPQTGRPFGDDVRRIFKMWFERHIPSPREAHLTFVDRSPYLRSRTVTPYRLDRDAELVRHWSGLTRSERDGVDTPAGRVEYLAVPLRGDAGGVLGVFVVAIFRDLERDPFDEAFLTTAAVALAVLLIGSLLAWRVAEGLLRPVRSVTGTARSITETDLSRRIEVQGDDEIAELAATFNAMLGRLEAAFAAQRRFLDDAGHELRTPLTIVHGHLELLEDEPAKREQTIALVQDELERMGRLVDDLLLLAKAEAPDFMRLETVDVAAFTAALHAKAVALAPRQWELGPVGRGLIVADRQRLTQAVMQLAENAVKHTDPDDVIRLSSSVAADAACFVVADTGRGVPAREQERIFERFGRGTGRSEGSGLGLAIVRAIAEAHGGRIELESREGEGATFTLSVPLDGPGDGA